MQEKSVKIKPKLHKKAKQISARKEITLKTFIERAIWEKIQRTK